MYPHATILNINDEFRLSYYLFNIFNISYGRNILNGVHWNCIDFFFFLHNFEI